MGINHRIFGDPRLNICVHNIHTQRARQSQLIGGNATRSHQRDVFLIRLGLNYQIPLAGFKRRGGP